MANININTTALTRINPSRELKDSRAMPNPPNFKIYKFTGKHFNI